MKVVVLTSVQENEGKSTVAANLAIALAAQNKRVLLIDGDLRHPSMYKVFEKKLTEDQEITNYLEGKIGMQSILTMNSATGLYYLFGSKVARDSDKLLRSEAMKVLIDTVKEKMDYVIIDTAPVAVNNDAEIVCGLADAAILIVKQGASRISKINEALDDIRDNRVNVLGCIFNAVHTRLLPGLEELGESYGNGRHNFEDNPYKASYAEAMSKIDRNSSRKSKRERN